MNNQITFKRTITKHCMFFSSSEHDKTVESYVFKIDKNTAACIEFSEFYPFESCRLLQDFFANPDINEDHYDHAKIHRSTTHAIDFVEIPSEQSIQCISNTLSSIINNTTFKDIVHLCIRFTTSQRDERMYFVCVNFMKENGFLVIYDTPEKIIGTKDKIIVEYLKDQTNEQ
jgi:hypothetical protein